MSVANINPNSTALIQVIQSNENRKRVQNQNSSHQTSYVRKKDKKDKLKHPVKYSADASEEVHYKEAYETLRESEARARLRNFGADAYAQVQEYENRLALKYKFYFSTYV